MMATFSDAEIELVVTLDLLDLLSETPEQAKDANDRKRKKRTNILIKQINVLVKECDNLLKQHEILREFFRRHKVLCYYSISVKLKRQMFSKMCELQLIRNKLYEHGKGERVTFN